MMPRRVCGTDIDRELCKFRLGGVVVNSRLMPGGHSIQSAECPGEL